MAYAPHITITGAGQWDGDYEGTASFDDCWGSDTDEDYETLCGAWANQFYITYNDNHTNTYGFIDGTKVRLNRLDRYGTFVEWADDIRCDRFAMFEEYVWDRSGSNLSTKYRFWVYCDGTIICDSSYRFSGSRTESCP